MQDFNKLNVWQRAHTHALSIRKAANQFPRSGYGSLKSQLVRASESIAFNIAEGCGASTPKEFARFLDISIRSASETESQLQLARDYKILESESWVRLSEEVVAIRKMLYRLKERVLS